MAIGEKNDGLGGRRREVELGQYSDERLETAVVKYGVAVTDLLSGRRFSLISAISFWEAMTGNTVWELTTKVVELSKRKELIALRALGEFASGSGGLTPEQRKLFDDFAGPAADALIDALVHNSYGAPQIQAALALVMPEEA